MSRSPEDMLARTSLVAGLVAPFLYGIFVVLFIFSTYLLVLRNMKSTGHRMGRRLGMFLKPTILFSILMFVTVTVGCLLTCVRTFEAFLVFEGGSNPGLFYSDHSRATEVAGTAFMLASVAFGDCMVMYRLWVVWDYNYYIIAPPISCTIAIVVCSTGLIYQLTQFVLGQSGWDSPVGRWITSDCILTVCTNLYSISLIIWRIWRINKALSYGGPKLASFGVMLVESAALFMLWTLVLLVTYYTRTDLEFFFMKETIGIVTGISFMLINVRVGLGSALKANHLTTIQTLPSPQQSFLGQPLPTSHERL